MGRAPRDSGRRPQKRRRRLRPSKGRQRILSTNSGDATGDKVGSYGKGGPVC